MYNTYTLKNGLRIVTEKIEHLNSISVGVMFRMVLEMRVQKLMEYPILLSICF